MLQSIYSQTPSCPHLRQWGRALPANARLSLFSGTDDLFWGSGEVFCAKSSTAGHRDMGGSVHHLDEVWKL
jgi:hypothetical protein